jgi:glycosyltransferase involved in cell wall biosynthesis
VPDSESIFSKVIRVKGYKKLIEQAICSSGTDIVFTSTYGIHPSLLVAKKYNIPIAAFVRAFENFECFNNTDKVLRFFAKRLMYGDFGTSSLKKMDYLLPNSEFVAGLCKKFSPPSEVKVIYPALNVDEVRKVKRAAQPKNIFIVGISDHKGFSMFKDLAPDFPKLNFHVVGDSTLNPGSEYTQGNVTFHGWVSVVDILANEADLLLVPSIWQEPFGRVAVEGLISGTPTLVSDIGGLPEAVNFEQKLLVVPDSKEAWRKSISAFITNPDEIFIATERAQKKIGKFSVKNQVSELEKVILCAVR